MKVLHIKLEPVDLKDLGDLQFLYDMLSLRRPVDCIRHKKMPSWEEHVAYVKDPRGRLGWYTIRGSDTLTQDMRVGHISLSIDRKVGIFVHPDFKRLGVGSAALVALAHSFPGPMLAEINPENEASLAFFKSFKAKHIQTTMEFDV